MTAAALTRSDKLALFVLGILLLVRIPFALLVTPPVVTDAQGYEAAAFRLAETGSYGYPLMTSGHWATEQGNTVVTESGRTASLSDPPNAYTLPGFPAFRAAILSITGDIASSRVWTRLAQALLSVLSAGLIYLIGRRFGARVGLLALALAAVYPPFTMANSYLQTEVLFTFLMLLSLYFFLRWSDTMAWRPALAAAATFGLSMWVRPSMALWAPLAAALVILGSRRGRARSVLQATAIGLTILLVLLPWWVRNGDLYGRFVPFSTSGEITAIEAIRMDVAVQLPLPWQEETPRQTAEQAQMESLVVAALSPDDAVFNNDAELSDHYRLAGAKLRATLLNDHLGALVAARVRSIFVSLFWPFAVSPSALGGLPFLFSWVVHGLVLVLFAFGAVVAPRRPDTLLLLSVPMYTVLVHLLLIPFHRYYFPAMPAVMVIAAVGLDASLSWLKPSAATEP